MQFLFVVIFAFLIVYFIMPCFICLASKNKFVDKPTSRKIHSRSVPLVGGIVMYLAFVFTFIVFIGISDIKCIAILFGATAIVIIGIVDDYYKTLKKEFSILPRLLVHLFAAVILYVSGIKFTGFMNPFVGSYVLFSGVWQFLLTVLWVFGVTTVINFSDGLDGLAGGFSLISSATLLIVALYKQQFVSAMIAAIIIGVVLGFLKYNIYPAKVFMGDSGANFLGYMLAVISLYGVFKQATIISVFIPVLALGVPIFDNLFVVIKRFLQHKPVYKADTSQIHYRLLNSGMNDKQVVKYLFVLNACLNLASIILLLLKI
jgi:UDP-N-acetylmuramyl pentapeptide phosphotransferase/UDP-N-acetylglucosamine-1-phosphate transferase